MNLPEVTTTKILLAEPYDGFWVEIHEDPEMGVYEDMLSGNFAKLFAGCAAVTTASNVVDRAGNPLDLTKWEGWRVVRRSMLLAIVRKIREAWELPKASSNGSATPSPSAAPQPASTAS